MTTTTKVRRAVIPAAGLGTRFLPATKALPKEMLPIVDVPTIQLVVEDALAAGIEEIILVTGRGKASIEDHFDHAFELERTLRDRGKADLLAGVERISRRVRLVSVRQKEPLGLGHAVLVAEQVAAGEPVAVLLGDDLFDTGELGSSIAQLCRVFEELGGQSAVVAVQEVEAGQEHMYGVIAGQRVEDPRFGGRLTRVSQMVEKPAPGTAPSRDAIVGRYVLPAAIWPLLRSTPPGRGGEIQLTDAIAGLIDRAGPGAGGCYGYRVEGVRHDAGDRLGYLGANLAYALQRPELRPGLLRLMARLLKEADAL